MPARFAPFTLTNLKGGVDLLTRGAANELVEHHNVSQPEADVMTLQALFSQLDDLADIPALLFAPVMSAIRASVENDCVGALADAEEEDNALIGEEADPHTANPL